MSFSLLAVAACGTPVGGDAGRSHDAAADSSTARDAQTDDALDARPLSDAHTALDSGSLDDAPTLDAMTVDAPRPTDASTARDVVPASDAGAPTPVQASRGCHGPLTAGDFVRRTVSSGSRTYWLHVPAGYTNATPEKLVFVWHGCNMSVNNIRSALTVEAAATAAADHALFVYPQITNATDPSAPGEGCFDWTRDAPYFDAVLADVEAAYCVDEHRVFSTGYSSGAIMSELIGCGRSAVVRAIAPAEGGFDRRDTMCAGRVDAYVIHSPLDEQIGWNTGAPVTSTNPYAWTDGRGYVPFSLLYANDGCSAPALDPTDATIGQIHYTCGARDAWGHSYRLWRWLHDYAVPTSWRSNTPHHWFPPEAPAAIWDFFATVP